MDNREKFDKTLLSIGRPGMEAVLKHLDALGFYKAPASTRFHGSTSGGLLQHSLSVYDEAMLIREAQLKLRPDMAERLPVESIAVAALLHDVCKAEVYVEMQKWRKDTCPLLAVISAADRLASHLLEA